jgi:UDP-glucose-4-epimerase GalE
MNVLVVGGAGYVGSHATRHLIESGYRVWVYDNFVLGHSQACPAECCIEGNILDTARLETILQDKQIAAVLHFAAFTLVGESVTDPAKYYRNNVVGTLSLLEAMRRAEVKKIVFSSTAAVYGNPQQVPIREDAVKLPVNPYGVTKLLIEQALADYAEAYGFGFAALRYFNASGASPTGDIGEDHQPESHLIPLVLQVALGQRPHITIFGQDYPTPDGTCIRDYIHVQDLAEAHVKALQLLQPGTKLQLNLGSGQGYSVNEVVQMCREVTGHAIPAVAGERRAGDPPVLVADPSLAQSTLSWQAKRSDLRTIVADAWRWHSQHPRGYNDR